MRWDDIWLLQQIDEYEEAGLTSYLINGLELLRRAAEVLSYQIDWNRDLWPFARELILAHDAGFVEWRDMSARSVGDPNPQSNTNYWLQQINELRLTLAGRDRARGRLIQLPTPDPEEDDGRPITGMTLEEVAKAISDTFGASQLPRYLIESGIPEEYVTAFDPSGGKLEYIFSVLDVLHESGSASRRALREFIGGWLDGRYYVAPRAEVRRHLVAILSQQGWHVRDGRLVVGARTYDSAGTLTPLGMDVRLAALHVSVRAVAERYIESNAIEVGIFEAMKAVNNRVKDMSGLSDDGVALMHKAFSESNPIVLLADLSTQTGKNIQEGFRFLFAGAVQGLRNPDAHEQFRPLDAEEGFEALAFASLLMRRLDSAKRVSAGP
jgi:uncharacterized protein (TIGR02391 family)